MVSPLKQHDRLDELMAAICGLRIALLDREREAGELLDGEEETALAGLRVTATRMRLEACKDLYIAEIEALRAELCPVHGEGRQVSCPDCVARSPHLKANHDAYLAAVRADERAA